MNSQKHTPKFLPKMKAWQSIVNRITKRRISGKSKITIHRDAAGQVTIEMTGSASSVIHALTDCLVEDIEFNRAVYQASRRASVTIGDAIESTRAIEQLIDETLK